LIAGAVGLATTAAAIRLGWQVAKPTSAAPELPTTWQIGGASMAPTLLGLHAELTCDACGVRWPVHWQAHLRPRGPVTCWNCGTPVPIGSALPQAGAEVTLISRRDDPRPPRMGELVACELPHRTDANRIGPGEITRAPGPGNGQEAAHPPGLDNRWAVKRVVATAGQQLAHRDGILLVDGRPIAERLEQAAADHPGRVARPLDIPVHDDRHRPGATPSRWRPLPGSAPPIAVDAAGFRLRARQQDATWEPSPWLAYHHLAVHDGLRPDVIRDDFPSNATEVRALHPVDRVLLRFRLDAAADGTVQVLFRLAGRVRTTIRTWQAGPRSLEFDSARGEAGRGDGNDFLESDSVPIAIRVLTGEAEISELVIRRPLQYRIEAADAVKGTWPLRLSEGQLYVLGDNVPLSIDSRQFGPIGAQRIVGRIEPT
jgi:type IV secretory pathway protease TraF